ncbi:hypothetical protein [Nitrosophilus alvini]|uniref:hypothetical protein n=1 Tax=Nitrosophilus alvini TaxID=2714855 RepID=UPI00190DFD10|nr:hypothetical protein [Nitrosophilus alvini]
MKSLKFVTFITVILFSTILCSADTNVWRKATHIFGKNANHYLYLALPIKTDNNSSLYPLIYDGKKYYIKKASYTIDVRNGIRKKRFGIDFSVDRKKVEFKGIKNGKVVNLGNHEVIDITYTIKKTKGFIEYHSYFKTLPNNFSITLFPGYIGSNLFGRTEPRQTSLSSKFAGIFVKHNNETYVWTNPSAFTNIDAQPFITGDKKFFAKKTLLDYAAQQWYLIAGLEIWNLFNYGIDKERDEKFRGILKMHFYSKPLEEERFGDFTLPFSKVGFELKYRKNPGFDKAELIVSQLSFIPKKSHFIINKKVEDKKIDMEIKIEIKNIEFEEIKPGKEI